MLKSLIANAKLAGIEIPSWLEKWIQDEYAVKITKMATEPVAATYENNEVKK